MNLDSLNKWLTLLANLGVIAGIVFLAIEMQQNTDMMRSQTRDSITGKLSDWFMQVSTDQNAAQILVRGNAGQPLDEAAGEGLIFSFIVLNNFRLWENEFYQYERGMFEEAEFLARKEAWAPIVKLPGYARLWEDNKNGYAPRFRAEIEALLIQ